MYIHPAIIATMHQKILTLHSGTCKPRECTELQASVEPNNNSMLLACKMR